MRRRKFITLLGGAAATFPLAARAQQGRTYRLGFIIPAGRDTPAVVAFLDELRLNGFVEGQNLDVIGAGFNVRREQVAEQAALIVKAAPDAIVGGPDIYTRALQAATRTIPIVSMSEDMVAEGLVASLARPGGNTTGLSIMSPELNGKRQEILIEAVPGLRRIAALSDSTVARPGQIQDLQNSARARGIELSIFGVAKPEEIVTAIDAAKSSGVQALNFLASSQFFPISSTVMERIVAVRLPSIHHWPEIAEQGGLLAYGSRITGMFRQRARQLVKILRGAKPADIPVEQPTTFELVINLKTAKAIGHEVPAGLVLRADKVIE
jgi:putative tryptophan/tyrosine transport system substrate-binding protein